MSVFVEPPKLNITKTIDHLLKSVTDRERDIILRRYGLKGQKKHTLEQIGKKYKITRERVRQIENNTLTKLKDIDPVLKKKSKLEDLNGYIVSVIATSGGVVTENHLMDTIKKVHKRADEDTVEKSLDFLLHHFIEDVHKLKNSDKRNTAWKLAHVDEILVDGIVDTLTKIIVGAKEPIHDKDLLNAFKQSEFFKKNEEAVMELCDINRDNILTLEEIFISYLLVNKKIKKNIFEKWGLVNWKNVQPKKINDKAYLVLLKAGKPLHFKEITDLINKAGFDSKVACPATVHNELILNDQYVLVGRGIYALKEWGYKEGTVIDVISNILTQAGKPLTKDEIVQEVLKKRIVRKSTIYLSLLNKNKFQKVGNNKYTVK